MVKRGHPKTGRGGKSTNHLYEPANDGWLNANLEQCIAAIIKGYFTFNFLW